ncbi:hypothetical protein [Halomonas sp. QHL1]|uniref:hypothetical protein n=1 Tax=Halomonas sp. QHL1 TaxID=1123773 RepID=UPI000AB31818|nr:hypothetical protein [Halomonas sp. QHL1]
MCRGATAPTRSDKRQEVVILGMIGSVLLLLRPAIRLHRYIYFKRLPDTNHDA